MHLPEQAQEDQRFMVVAHLWLSQELVHLEQLVPAHGADGGAVALWACKAESHQPLDTAVPVQCWAL